MTTEHARVLFVDVAVDKLRAEAERWYGFVQMKYEDVERRAKYQRMLGEAYGRLSVHLDHGEVDQATAQLDYIKFFANDPEFPVPASKA
jgi:hypothetical protein